MTRATRHFALTAAITLIAAGCAQPADGLTTAQLALTDGTPDAVGLLAFLNDSSTSVDVLDHQVPLDARAAKHLIAHRDGVDGLFGTADDDLFDDVAEVDGVYWVGPTALARLTSHAWDQGWTPMGDELLGTWDKVDFTVDQAAAVLDLVNAASFETLDIDFALDKRAAKSIADAQPVLSVATLAGLYYVGPSALNQLKSLVAAPVVQAPTDGPGADCLSTSDCADGLTCVGKTNAHSPAYGKCVDMSYVPGEWDDCTVETPCGEGLVCMGALSWGTGWCVQAWMAGTFESQDVAPIPDADLVGVSSQVVAYGLATVPLDIQVTLDIEHPRPEDLVITLTSPNGDVATLWDQVADGPNPVMAAGIPGDDMVGGAYTLTVTDLVAGETGVIRGWSLYITSNWD